ncbi:MAG: hypothetical protein HZR80_07035 [Candidatus Heimdallarchaeota archaeon]
MIFDLPLADPQEVLSPELYALFSKLIKAEHVDLPIFINLLQSHPVSETRLFVLLHLHEYKLLPGELFIDLATAFLGDLDETIQWHCLLFLGYYNSSTTKAKSISPFLSSPTELVRAAAYWLLARLHPKTISAANVFKELTTAFESDRSRILLGAALFLLDSSPTSPVMDYLKKYFLTEYWDTEENSYQSTILHSKYGSSAKILAVILWFAGIQIVTNSLFDSLELHWLIGQQKT